MFRLGQNGISEKPVTLVEVYQSVSGHLPRLIWLNGELKTPLPAAVVPVPDMPDNIMIRLITPYQPSGTARNQPFDINYYLRSIAQKIAWLQDLYTDQATTSAKSSGLRSAVDSARLTQSELFLVRGARQGKMCCGRTPLETLLKGKSIWAEKNLAQI